MSAVTAEETGQGEFQVRVDTGDHQLVMDELKKKLANSRGVIQ